MMHKGVINIHGMVILGVLISKQKGRQQTSGSGKMVRCEAGYEYENKGTRALKEKAETLILQGLVHGGGNRAEDYFIFPLSALLMTGMQQREPRDGGGKMSLRKNEFRLYAVEAEKTSRMASGSIVSVMLSVSAVTRQLCCLIQLVTPKLTELQNDMKIILPKVLYAEVLAP